MTIAELKNHRISPFEIDDPQMLKLFSFFLHQAPTIESSSAANIDEVRLEKNWNDFIGELSLDKYCFIHPNSKKVESYLADYCLDPQSVLNRRAKGFVCKRKQPNEKDYECILKHLRNSIAHSNVFLSNAGNRKYVYFEDFNSNKVLSAAILLSQTDLVQLKKKIMR